MGKLLDHLASAFTGNKRQTGERVLSIAQRGKHGGKDSISDDEFRSLCMSIISQARK